MSYSWLLLFVKLIFGDQVASQEDMLLVKMQLRCCLVGNYRVSPFRMDSFILFVALPSSSNLRIRLKVSIPSIPFIPFGLNFCAFYQA